MTTLRRSLRSRTQIMKNLLFWRRIAASGALLLLFGAYADAATILWTSKVATTSGTKAMTLNTGLFDSTGTLVLAENSGGGAVSFDGINFAAGSISFGSATAGFHDSSSTLSYSATYNTGSASTVTFNSLTVGQTYRIQLLIFDGRGGASGRTLTLGNGDGSTTTDLGPYANGVNNVTWGTGLLAIGTFTANATTQSFTNQIFEPNGTTSDGSQMNALVLQMVPEPGAWVSLVGGCGVLLGLRRRRY
jgi:hypothetical protein